MRKTKYTLIPVIVCFVVAFSGVLPVSALTSEDMIQREGWQAPFEGVDVANTTLRFSTAPGYAVLNATQWRWIALNKSSAYGFLTFILQLFCGILFYLFLLWHIRLRSNLLLKYNLYRLFFCY